MSEKSNLTVMPRPPETESWWRLSLMGHRTIITRIEAVTFLGVLMWRLEGDEMVNPVTAVFGVDPWTDPRPLLGLPEGWSAQRSSTFEPDEFIVEGAGGSWHINATEEALRAVLAGDAALRSELAQLPVEVLYRAKRATGAADGPVSPWMLVPVLDAAKVAAEAGDMAATDVVIDEHGDDIPF